MFRFNVTYEIITPESAERGEVDETGYISKDVDLRTALEDVAQTRTGQCGGVMCVETDASDAATARCVTVYNGMDYSTGEHENRSLHFPANVTGATRQRIARLMGAL